MSKKIETEFIGSVHKYLPPTFYRVKHFNPYSGGMADCWYSGVKDLWIEYKYVLIPKREGTYIVPDLSELQKDWLNGRRSEGRNVLVIVGSKNGGVVLRDSRLWEEGLSAAAFVSQLKTRKELADFIVRECS